MGNFRKTYDDAPAGKVGRYVHSPITVEYENNITVSISKDGKITIQQNHPDGYDEVLIPASMIRKIQQLLYTTRKFKYVDKEEVSK